MSTVAGTTVDIPDHAGTLAIPAPAPAPGSRVSIIRDWATAAVDAAQLVRQIIDTPFVPESYRPRVSQGATPEQRAQAVELSVAVGTAAVLQGAALGLDPLTALQQIIIIHGRPSMYAKLMVGLVVAAGHAVWVEEATSTRAVVCGQRSGSSHEERVIVTMQQAQSAGWTRNPNYKSNPADMLVARASSRVCARVAPDVILGLASVEAVEDEGAVITVGTGGGTVRAPKRRRATVTAETPAETPLAAVTRVTIEGPPSVTGIPPAQDQTTEDGPGDPVPDHTALPE